MSKINYTIIIPHYNNPLKLQRCLNSIPSRDDVEVIIIDDNSSSEIVDFNNLPKSTVDNFHYVLSKEGGGAGYARNIGLRKASGKWIIFSDSDDEFYTTELSYAMDKHINTIADIIYFNANVINAETFKVENSRLEISKHINQGNESDKEWLRYESTVPWGKFIKKELVDKFEIMFDQVPAGNDVMFSLKTGHYANEVYIDNIIIYKWYFYQKGSITSLISKSTADSKFSVALNRLAFLKEINKVKYRSNLFIGYIPFYMKVGYSFYKSYNIVYRKIPKAYVFKDTIEFILFSIRKATRKIGLK